MLYCTRYCRSAGTMTTAIIVMLLQNCVRNKNDDNFISFELEHEQRGIEKKSVCVRVRERAQDWFKMDYEKKVLNAIFRMDATSASTMMMALSI